MADASAYAIPLGAGVTGVEENIKGQLWDHILHYFSCLKFTERGHFFEDTNRNWVLYYFTRRGGATDKSPKQERKEAISAYRRSWEESCRRELRRVAFLRETLARDPAERHLVERLTESRSQWMSHLHGTGDSITNLAPERPERTIDKPYNPEKDIDVPVIYLQETDIGLRGVDARIDGVVRGAFPNQKTTLDKLLGQDFDRLLTDNPLLGSLRPEESLKYFHIPYNNMEWAEETIENYFNRFIPTQIADALEGDAHAGARKNNVTSDPYWRSQFQGGQKAKPYSRRLRPLSSIIAPGTGAGDNSGQNVVVFMPYLHWEAYSQRQKCDGAVKETVRDLERLRREREQLVRSPRFRHRRNRHEPLVVREVRLPRPDFAPSEITSWGNLLQRLNMPPASCPMDAKGRVYIKNPLGQYLLDAARLFQGMAEYTDKVVIREYVMSNSPLHPRRTLEQGYHWTLHDGEEHSKDQVMYRATKARAFHTFDPKTGRWPEHELAMTDNCDKCRDDSRKVASLVMVDQLWMWILDSKYIITCFPDQYGGKRHKSSGVDKSIRTRIQNWDGRYGSVFDLGLVIIDECSNAIFDKTKAAGGQPELVDAFSAAIGDIRNRQQSLFRKFWGWANEIEVKIQVDGNSADIRVPLDLFTEGMLIRELKNIIEELDIMIYTMRTQRETLRTFIANAERILDPLNEFRSSTQRIYISRQRRKNTPSEAQDRIEDEEDRQRAKLEDIFYRFRSHADETFARHLARIENLEELRDAANAGVESVKDLLELKGQQASLVQAWRSTAQSEETVNQGRVILVFTLVTIIFLPLSFMSSIFGMNNVEFGSGTWFIHDEVVYMVTISVSVIVVTLGLAFSPWPRALIWYIYKVVTTWFLVWTGLFSLWHRFVIPAETLQARGRRLADGLLHNAAQATFNRIRRETLEREAMDSRTRHSVDAREESPVRATRQWSRRAQAGSADPENGDSLA